MKSSKIVMMTVMLAAVAMLSACAATKQARHTEISGFLTEYRSMIRPGTDEETLLIYRKPDLNISGYKKIMVAPVTVWDDPANPLTADQRNDYLMLADSFHAVLAEKLSKDYEMVDKFGPETMRIQVAIIHGEKTRVGLAFISKVVPQARALNTLWSFVTGKPAFTGAVNIEFKFTDAATGELLGAGADARVGTLKLMDKNAFQSWGDVKNAFTFWGDFTLYRLCHFRGDANCVKPSA